MTLYQYQGPQTSLTIGEQDYYLFDGDRVELDETNKYVQRLCAIGRLTPVKAEATAPIETEAPTDTTEAASEPTTRNKNRNSH